MANSNYEILSFLEEEGMEINEDIIYKSAEIGDLFLFKHFTERKQPPKDILLSSLMHDNVELVKYVLENLKFDVNARNVFLFYSMFVLIF